MKKIILILNLLSVVAIQSFAQDKWTSMPAFPGVARIEPLCFSIGNKGYVCTGSDQTFNGYNDVWQWDSSTNAWSKIDTLPQGCLARAGGVGFSIGTKGYIGTGWTNNNGPLKDIWQYDPLTNVWTQEADFGGIARYDAVAFTIGNKGYVGMGGATGAGLNDFWEYDPVSNRWAAMADLPASGRYAAVGFSIGNKGYIGTGSPSDANYSTALKDFYEWDQTTNTWLPKADFAGSQRIWAVAFSIANKGYIATGLDNTGTSTKDCWEYDTTGNGKWTMKANASLSRFLAGAFAFNSTAYVVDGSNNAGSSLTTFEQYKPSSVTGIVSQTQQSVSVNIYPNPNNGLFTLSINATANANYAVEVRNMLGQMIYSEKLDGFSDAYTKQLDMKEHGSGIYLVSLKTQDNETSARVLSRTLVKKVIVY